MHNTAPEPAVIMAAPVVVTVIGATAPRMTVITVGAEPFDVPRKPSRHIHGISGLVGRASREFSVLMEGDSTGQRPFYWGVLLRVQRPER